MGRTRSRTAFLLSFIGLITLSLLNGCGNKKTDKKEAENKPTNAVLFVVDDMGWKDVGAYGSDFYQTPNIDKLAADGILFDNAYASCTVCSPSRASIMTGKYPATLNLTDWIEGWKYPKAKLSIPDWTKHLDLAETTLAEIFRDAGYKTAHLGKWHLGEDEKYWPENQGFDVNYGGWSKGRPSGDKKLGAKGYFAPYGNPRLSDPKGEEYLTERLAAEASQFIEKEKDNPFFLNFWFYNVHTPLQARKEKIEKYETLIDPKNKQKNPIYAAMVEHVDEAVGKVVKKLKEKNLYDNTIIIFTSDNGGLIGNVKNKVTNNFPLREGKGGIYEGGVRVPLIVKMPDNQNAGSQQSTPVTSIDYMPTLIDFLDLQIPKGLQAEMDGVSLLPILENNDEILERGSLYWHYPHYHRQGATPYSAVRNGEWKLIHVLESDTYELYNLEEDIGEQNDLSKQYPEMQERLKQDLNNWRRKVGAQMPAPNPNYSPTTNN